MTKVHEYMTLARYMYVEKKRQFLGVYYEEVHDTVIYQEKKKRERIVILI